jgi:anti-sigma regulatory factor (Ser/Thr protein kinase)
VPISQEPHLEQRLPARPESIAKLRHAIDQVAERGGASRRRREDIALAVSEALSNIVVHAYPGYDAPGDMWVDAWIHDDALQVSVCDDGIGMVPRSDSPGLGLGLALMGQVCEQMRLETRDAEPGVRVRMTFALN